MRSIKALPESVRSSMRSGIILFDLTRVVEELVFNSLDAGATKVIVAVGVGTNYIKVTDNGCGVTRDGLVLLGERYATSKFELLADMNTVPKSFGFRGEAISSLSDVSIVEIVTKSHGMPNGYRKVLKGCKCLYLGIDDDRQDVGTTVVVRDLFYNQPVRRRHLQSSPQKVLHSVRECILRIALVHLRTCFKVIDIESGDELLCLYPSSSPLPLLMNVFGTEVASPLHKLDAFDGDLSLSGYISGPYETLSVKAFQYFYISSRYISRGPLHKLLNQLATSSGLLNRSQCGKRSRCQVSPTYILNLSCPRAHYDLSFEPNKTLVEFKDWDPIFTFIKKTVSSFWNQEMSFGEEKAIWSGADTLATADDLLNDYGFPKKRRMTLSPPQKMLREEPKHRYSCNISSEDIYLETNCMPHVDHLLDAKWNPNSFQTDNRLVLKEPSSFSFHFDDDVDDLLRPFLRSCSSHMVLSPVVKDDNKFRTPVAKSIRDDNMFITPVVKSIRDDNMLITPVVKSIRDDNMFITPVVKSIRDDNMFITPVVKSIRDDNMFITPVVKSINDDKMFITPVVKSLRDDDKFGSPVVKSIRDDNMFISPVVKSLRDDYKFGSSILKSIRDDDKFRTPVVKSLRDDDNFGSPVVKSIRNDNEFRSPVVKSIRDDNKFRSPVVNKLRFQDDGFSKWLCMDDYNTIEPWLNDAAAAVWSPTITCNLDTDSSFLTFDSHMNDGERFKASPIQCSKSRFSTEFVEPLTNVVSYKDDSDDEGEKDIFNFNNIVSPFHKCNGSGKKNITKSEMECDFSGKHKAYADVENNKCRFQDKQPRRSRSAPPFYKGKKKFLALNTWMKSHLYNSPKLQEESHLKHVQESSGADHLILNEALANNFQSKDRRDKKKTIDKAEVSVYEEEAAHWLDDFNCHTSGFTTMENQDFGGKWRNGCSGSGTTSIDKVINILDLSSGILHLLGDSLVPKSISRKCLEDSKVLQQVDKKFIPFVGDGILAIIDQHAADERIRLEELRGKVLSGEMKTITYLDAEQELVLPEIGYQLLNNYSQQIQEWGWICNFHAQSSISFKKNLNFLHNQRSVATLKAVPCILGVNLTDVDLLEFLEQLSETDGSSRIPQAVLRVLNYKACRGAIMFGDALFPSECSLIVEELKRTSLSFQCAHGRPTTAPLVNLRVLHKQLENMNRGSGESWHGLSRHRPSLERAAQQLASKGGQG